MKLLVIRSLRNYSLKSALGFYTNDIKQFLRFCEDLKLNNTDRMLKKCSEVAIHFWTFLKTKNDPVQSL